ncbi:MAG: hypothetical protein C4334_12145 [Pyrinomonas sp.]|uniref:glycosyltransferase n=1 Tax=Pyrinomonas sp. TaxID=2080306 RepID=UPI00331B0602
MKRNVLLLIGSFEQGGSERQAVQLARLLCESGRYNLRVACLDGRGVLRAEIERLGLGEMPEFKLNSFYGLNMLKQLHRAARFMRKNRIDVVQTFDFYTNVFGMMAATMARVRVRIAAKRETEGVRTPTQKWVERRAFNLAHAIVANAQAVCDRLIAEGVRPEKIVTIHNWLDLERVAPPVGFEREETLRAFNLPDGLRFVTIVANMRNEVKDHRTFLRAARRVAEAVSDVGFALAGEGELMEALKREAAELGLRERAFFLGRCERVAELLAISDVCVLSSKAEGFSNSILEYMAAGKPVVATDVGGAREAIVEGETGYLVAPGDDATMAARIIALLREPERARRMGERGRTRVRENFSAQVQLRKVEALYRDLLASNFRQKATQRAVRDDVRDFK